MGDKKIINRTIRLSIDGKSIPNDVKSIETELRRLRNEQKKLTIGSKEYIDKGKDIRQLNGILTEHRKQLKDVGNGFTRISDKFKSMFSSVSMGWTKMVGMISAGIASISAVIAGAKWWYNYNVEIEDSQRLTKEFLGLTGDSLIKVRSRIQAISNTFGKDYKDVLSAVDTLMVQYGISAEKATKIVEDGFVSGADESGNMLGMIKQYAPTFHDLGINASQLVAIISQTRSGIFSEKGMDLISMASKRIREMSTETAKSLDAIGMNSKTVEKELTSGSKSTFDIIQEISSKLKTMPADGQAVGNVLRNVFGRNGAEGGLKMIESLSTITTKMKDVKKVTGEYGQLKQEEVDEQTALNEELSKYFGISRNGYDEMTMKAKIYIMKGLGSIIGYIANIINYFIRWYNSSMLVRGAIQTVVGTVSALLHVVGPVFGIIISSIKNTVKELKGLADILEGVVTLNFSKVKLGFKEVGNSAVNEVKDVVKQFIKADKGFTKSFIDAGKSTLKGHADEIGKAQNKNLITTKKAWSMIGKRKKMGSYIVEWDGTKWTVIRRIKEKKGSENGNGNGSGNGNIKLGNYVDPLEAAAEKKRQAAAKAAAAARAKAEAEAKKKIQKELDAIDAEYDKKESKTKKDYMSGSIKTQEEYNQKMADLEMERLEAQMKVAGLEPKKREELNAKIQDAKMKLYDQLNELMKNNVDDDPTKELDNKLKLLKNNLDAELEMVEDAYHQKLIDDKKYQEDKAALEKKYNNDAKAAQEEDAKKQLDIREKTFELMQQALELKDIKEGKTEKKTNRDLLKQQIAYYDELLKSGKLSKEETLDIETKRAKAVKELTKDTQDTILGYVELFSSSMDALMNDFFKGQKGALKDFLKSMLTTILDAVEKELLALYAADLAKNIVKFSFVGIAKTAGEMALITAAFSVAKAAINNFDTGGFTPDGDWNEPQGIVHSNEFIANRFATRNKNLAPVFGLIDQAQKRGSVQNLSGEDIASVALSQQDRQRMNTQSSISASVNGMSGSSNATGSMIAQNIRMLALLNKQLQKPLKAETYATGKHGTIEATDLVTRMQKNVSR
jgi:hypothetical protein